MSRVSLPGLSLSAAVVVAALLALLALESSVSEPGQYQSPAGSDAIMRLSESSGRAEVKGRQASSLAERRRARLRAGRGGGAVPRAIRRARAARATGRGRRTAGRGQASRGSRRAG